jgi:succinate dehydrogenase / fumarate reductase cytochrome b subunit
MNRFARFYSSTLGKKAVVAVTGLILFGFLVLHVIGNLKGFLPTPSGGTPDIDIYAHFLTVMGAPLLPDMFALWAVRIILGVSLIFHIVNVVQLAARNRRSRPIGYKHPAHVSATAPARWMLWTGSGILIFLVFHLLQFTTGTIDPTPIVYGKVYSNLYHAFQIWWILLIYIAAMAFIALHIFHGLWSAFQTLGIDNPDRNRGLRLLALGSALFLFLAFLSLPTLLWFDVMPEPPNSPSTPVALVE